MGFPNMISIADIVYSVGATVADVTNDLSNTTLTTYNATNGNVILAMPNFLSGSNYDHHFSNFMLTDINFYILTAMGRYDPGNPIIISGYCPT